MKKTFLALLFVVFVPSFSYANDTSGYVLPTGGVMFEKQDGIKMKVEALYIRPKHIEVNYLFENTMDKDITTQVFFPLPEMSAVSDYHGYYRDAAHQFNFKLWINGKETKYQTHFTLKQNHRNVPASALQLWKTPEESLDFNQFNERVAAMPAKDRQRLVDEKYLEWDWTFVKDPKTNEWEEGEGWTITSDTMMWKKQISYSWQQTFPARKTVSVRHTYTPSYTGTNTGVPFSKCIDYESKQYQDFAYLPPEERAHEWDTLLKAENYLEYILTTANNWQGPIENFNLLIESSLKSVGCLDGVAFYEEDFFAVNRQNYTPNRDMSVDFLDKYFHHISDKYTPKSEPGLYRIDGPANLRDNPNGKVIGQLANDTYVWVWPDEKKGKWYPVRQNNLSGYTHKQNLLKVF